MSKEKKKTDPVVIFLDLIIIALFFVMVTAGFSFYHYKSMERQLGTFTQNATEMSFDLEKNNYSSLVRGAYMNDFNKTGYSSKYRDLAKYTEAAFHYKIYTQKQNEAEANRQKEIMDSSRKGMGNLTMFADKIDRMLK